MCYNSTLSVVLALMVFTYGTQLAPQDIKQTQILDPHDRKSLTGFNGVSTWTEGSGYIPMVLEDPKTGNSIKMDIENAEAMSGIQSNIRCMERWSN